MKANLNGPLAALLTPRDRDGAVDVGALKRNVEFVVSRGATGVVVGGATGEYALLGIEQRRTAIEAAAAALGGRGALIAGVGAAELDQSLALARHAFGSGADAVLLPAPHFYRYEQRDLAKFFSEAAGRIDGPVLLYNLPDFTGGLATDLVLELIENAANIVGVKDSSGSLGLLEELTRRNDLEVVRILGNDRVLPEALSRGLIDAAVSGPAGVLPEITAAMFRLIEQGDSRSFDDLATLFLEMIEQLGALPSPWGLKLMAQARGLFPARFAMPLSGERKRQANDLEVWLEDWWSRWETVNGDRSGSLKAFAEMN